MLLIGKRDRRGLCSGLCASLTALVLGFGPGVPSACAQSADKLIEKLVQKGVLTAEEATDLRHETDADFDRAVRNRTDMPDWVTGFKVTGGFAGRVEQFHAEDPAFADRTRYRYRVRLGTFVTLGKDVEIGLQLSSGEFDNRYGGGNPVSGQSTLGAGASRKPVFFELAYARWNALDAGDFKGSVTVGKMRNPFLPEGQSDNASLLFDQDLFPEGGALSITYQINQKQSVNLTGGYFVLGEVSESIGTPFNILSPSHDPAFWGAQMTWNAHWTQKLETSLTVAVFSLDSRENLWTPDPGFTDYIGIPNVNDGNTRLGDYRLAYAMNPVMVSPVVTYTLASFPFFPGDFPIRLFGDYVVNPAAPKDNEGYRAGIMFGKASRKGTWDVSYRYQSLEADAWYEELVDDNNGAYFGAARPGTGFFIPVTNGAGYRGGTNIRGHWVQFRYALTDSLLFSFDYYLARMINPYPVGSETAAGHFFSDLEWKF